MTIFSRQFIIVSGLIFNVIASGRIEMKSKKQLPKRPNNINKKGQTKDPDGTVLKYTIVDEIVIPQSDAPQKLIYLQKIVFDTIKRVELRLCYYIIGKLPKMKGKWVFGQYATFLPEKDFKVIVNKARKKGWI